MIDVTKETLDQFLVECGKALLQTLAEEKSYIEQAQQGNQDAMQTICHASMRFVVAFANAHKGDLDIISAIHIAEPGLIHAVKTYDTASDIKFIAYAAECMKECFKKMKVTKIITESSSKNMNEETDGIMPYLSLDDFACLTDREREVMQMLTGVGCARMSVDEVADHFELLPSRIRQIRDKALKKMNL